jgi:hypothetical protein
MKEVGTMGKRMGKESTFTVWAQSTKGIGRMTSRMGLAECTMKTRTHTKENGCMGRKVEKESTFTTQEMFMKEIGKEIRDVDLEN